MPTNYRPESLVVLLVNSWVDRQAIIKKIWFRNSCNILWWRQHHGKPESLVSCLNTKPWDDGSTLISQKAWFHVSMQHHGMTAALWQARKLGFMSQCITMGWWQHMDKTEILVSCLNATLGWRQHYDKPESLVSCLNATAWDDGSTMISQKAWFHVSMQQHGMTAALW